MPKTKDYVFLQKSIIFKNKGNPITNLLAFSGTCTSHSSSLKLREKYILFPGVKNPLYSLIPWEAIIVSFLFFPVASHDAGFFTNGYLFLPLASQQKTRDLHPRLKVYINKRHQVRDPPIVVC